MKILNELSWEYAFGTSESTQRALDYAETFTNIFQQCCGMDPAEREARLLAVQFPALLLLPKADDCFVGRIRYGIVGLSPEPAGLGYYFAYDAVDKEIERLEALSDGSGRNHIQRLQALRTFWKGRTTAELTRGEIPQELAHILPTDAWSTDSGIAFPLYRQAGTVLNYPKLLELGLDGLENEAISCGTEPFYTGCRRAIAILRTSIDHYRANLPESCLVDEEDLLAIRHHPPQTFRQAIQLFWLYALHSGTWNYGRLDIALGPFLARDLDSEKITEAEALDYLCSLWLLMNDYANIYNNRVIIGGMGRPDEAGADQFALLAIEATRRVRLNQPQLSLRFYRGQNPALWNRGIDAIAEGCTFPMLYNDDVNVTAVSRSFGVSKELAEQYTPFGCGEYVLSHYGMGTPNGVINMLKTLEVVLHEGTDPVTGVKMTQLPLPELSQIQSFEQLWDAYAALTEECIEALARFQKLQYEVVGREASFLFASLLTSDCMERGKGILQGGVRHLGGTLETYGNTNTADSLLAIKELVFNRRIVTLEELREALDNNYRRSPELLQECARIAKYGNDEGLADAMACKVHEHVCRLTSEQATKVGLDSYLVVIINNWANTVLGKTTQASADGRLAWEPMANGNNPSPGSDTSGVTAFLNSLVKLSPDVHAGAVQNMKFSREWFGDNRPRFEALLHTYFANGGPQAMITVLSREDLEQAMQEPEKWGHLMVRVGGFSIRFVDLPREAQKEVLNRTLH